MRRLTIARLLILLAAVFLLLAPVLDGVIDHDPLQGPHADYSESTLCMLAATMTAGIWVHRAALAAVASLARPMLEHFVSIMLGRSEPAPHLALLSLSPPCPLRV
jgi:hypothetical protein